VARVLPLPVGRLRAVASRPVRNNPDLYYRTNLLLAPVTPRASTCAGPPSWGNADPGTVPAPASGWCQETRDEYDRQVGQPRGHLIGVERVVPACLVFVEGPDPAARSAAATWASSRPLSRGVARSRWPGCSGTADGCAAPQSQRPSPEIFCLRALHRKFWLSTGRAVGLAGSPGRSMHRGAATCCHLSTASPVLRT